MFPGTHLEPVGELRQEGERPGEGYQDERQDRIHCKLCSIAPNAIADDPGDRSGKPLCGVHGY